MSSPSHPTSNIEDAFSSNFPDYIPASPDYVPASPGKTYSSSSNNSFGLVPIASPTLSLFHDDPYMKVMHAYYAKESPIPPPTIVPPSSMLSPIFPPKDTKSPVDLHPLYSSVGSSVHRVRRLDILIMDHTGDDHLGSNPVPRNTDEIYYKPTAQPQPITHSIRYLF
ncbi:hypothetical protein Tco_1069868 [Tanacetum coccineum]|uniref:Uncharacterized protein n=1 Tax=Tanacetum coccineum TaxID=301880 RepID=A0ABQ5HL88_9ASTR